ncbi:hypothetical protein GCM10007891_04880 [Methylophaga thalassica]|uniref:DUF3397 domain-containing protein n=1 Tax=Methylophaga thalassica TaxID=40223 RepID=A0ABQ5TRR3_9GAMM|nr:hypothetical protein [Methylophaga thalassica]GLP98634.1 hypothetical protein GCM10007891_04880 [Methylophaga thalassica]
MDVLSHKQLLIATISLFPYSIVGFYVVLRLLNVKEELLKRSVFLSLLFTGLLLFIRVSLALTIPILSGWATVITAVAFALIIPKYLTLKNWQAIAIPFGVYVFAHLFLALTLMAVFNLVAR